MVLIHPRKPETLEGLEGFQKQAIIGFGNLFPEAGGLVKTINSAYFTKLHEKAKQEGSMEKYEHITKMFAKLKTEDEFGASYKFFSQVVMMLDSEFVDAQLRGFAKAYNAHVERVRQALPDTFQAAWEVYRRNMVRGPLQPIELKIANGKATAKEADKEFSRLYRLWAQGFNGRQKSPTTEEQWPYMDTHTPLKLSRLEGFEGMIPGLPNFAFAMQHQNVMEVTNKKRDLGERLMQSCYDLLEQTPSPLAYQPRFTSTGK